MQTLPLRDPGQDVEVEPLGGRGDQALGDLEDLVVAAAAAAAVDLGQVTPGAEEECGKEAASIGVAVATPIRNLLEYIVHQKLKRFSISLLLSL